MMHQANNAGGQGLYVPQFESDACGVGFVANLHGRAGHALVSDALTMLANMEHRGACGCETNSGDGAGILLQMPHAFLKLKTSEHGINLPEPNSYGAGMVFFPQEPVLREACRQSLNDYAREQGFTPLGYRPVPTDNSSLGNAARSTEPVIEQWFLAPSDTAGTPKDLERRLFVLRQHATHNIHRAFPQVRESFYIASLSCCTIVYKGQLTAPQLRGYYPDLQDTLFEAAIAVVHARFSTNTSPQWRLAQPMRYLAHNGEINTIQGNIRHWEAREGSLNSDLFSREDLEKLRPVCMSNQSDSAVFDNVFEFMHLCGRSLPHALMMMVPEAWQYDKSMDAAKTAFYQYHALLMEPWDGPAAFCFTDGTVVGAMLDRNGLRPARFCLLDDGTLILSSEAGALPVDPARVLQKGSLKAGKILLADLSQRRIIADQEVKRSICRHFPYKEWLQNHTWRLEELPEMPVAPPYVGKDLLRKQKTFGYTREDLSLILHAMAENAEEPVGSMGADIPLAVLSEQPQHLSHYFKQLFAQVTNPPIDPIREKSVMSLYSPLCTTANLMGAESGSLYAIHLDSPVLDNAQMAKLAGLKQPHFRPATLELVFPSDGQQGRLAAAIDRLCAGAEDAVRKNHNLLILTDRSAGGAWAAMPSLLATGAVHQHLSRIGLRGSCSLITECGDAREVHHLAMLLGYGANAVNPYLAFDSITANHGNTNAATHFKKACDKGLLKIMSKMGISTLQSYRCTQAFEALGLGPEVIKRCFTGTVSRLGGIDFNDVADDVLSWHKAAHEDIRRGSDMLDHGGIYQWQRDGEAHLFTPQSIHLLQHAVRTGSWETYVKYTKAIGNITGPALTLRSLLTFRTGTPVLLDEVESAENIMRRFSTGAMSFGSLSHEAHSTLAIAMNRIGAKSNSGEGGEDEARSYPLPNGDYARSAVRQVASGRFGVTSAYLADAEELQIKMAQGAKPGEGGQLPGHKVDEWIARVRHATPGVTLISPPPHHDIYSIEDLAQLIYDLKGANPAARISVKLVSKTGVGIIASGVAKARADAIMISGHDGGTGASPLSSIRHAGLPWELGLAETHQTLVRNGLRRRVVLQTDGQLRTGRDIAIATLLGADEWSIATAALVAEGCIMMRKCHLNTCPVGIATQDPELRNNFTGKADHIVQFFRFLAEDMRRIMAELGFRTVAEMTGQVEMLRVRSDLPAGKVRKIDLSALLFKETEPVYADEGHAGDLSSQHLLSGRLDQTIMPFAALALREAAPYHSVFNIKNTDRATGTQLSYE
ncbi:MAG: glutamate synthase large subunit, partial [Saprospiraceae bacterium]|nr:glutamate synthase large subunit [Saprospiraceae bacterium]